jgi:CHAT domain-containing protein/tetratricopeptide (TPR) repeat protein
VTPLTATAGALLIGFATLVSTHPSVVTAQTPVVQTVSSIRGFAESLETIRDLLNRGRGIEAENVARALLARVESLSGGEVLEVAEVLDLLGRAVRRSPKVAEEDKREFAERSLAIKEKVLGPWHPDVATSLTNLAIQRTLATDPTGAKPLLERALAIREKAFGPDHLSVAATLQSLAGVLMTVRDDAGATVLLERVLRIREMYGPEHLETIQTLFKVAMFYGEIHEYAGARQIYERALGRAEKTLAANHPLVFDILLRLATVLSEGAGDYAASARLNERLVAGVEKSFGVDDARLRWPLGNLAVNLRELGDYSSAQALAERSLAIAERAFGPRHQEVADSLHTLATIVAAQGDYAKAMGWFERATQIRAETSRSANPEFSRAFSFIPDLFPVSGYGSDDTILFEQAVAIRERDRGLVDPGTTDSLTNLAAVLSSVEDYKRTRPLFERALASQDKALGPDHPEVAAAATNLAHVLSQLDDGAAAKPLFERALSIWEKALAPDHPKVAAALLNLARWHFNAEHYDDATPLVARALLIQQQRLGAEHPDVATTLTNAAMLAAHTGASNDAFALAARAEVLSREHMRLTARTLSERQALGYAASRASALNVMLSVTSRRASDSEASSAFDAVIRARGLVLDEMAARRRAASATEDPDTATLTRALASARQRLAGAVVRGIRDEPPERYRRLLDQARNDKDRAERDLAERSARFREDQSISRAGLAELSAALPAGGALVGFVQYSQQDFERAATNTRAESEAQLSYLAFVLRSGEGVPAIVSLGSAATVDALILQWRRQLDQEAMVGRRSSTRSEIAYRRVAAELRQRVWDPLGTHLSNVTRVFVVPDGALHLVSLAALPTGASQYLVETGPLIHYLSAERDLVPILSARPASGSLLALGGPAFDESAFEPVRSEASFRGARSACADFQAMHFAPLPAAVKEVEQVTTLWNKAHGIESGVGRQGGANPSLPYAMRLTGAAASESAFKLAAPGHRVLHLATHGFFLGDRCTSPADAAASTAVATSVKIGRENPLLLSGLILAGANRRNVVAPGQEDGVLTAEEVAALDLTGVEWAVLSGCDTGVGQVRAGEGVFGLRRAFQVAGVQTVIMSLWPVEDQAARQWMATLYASRFLKKVSTADAVRAASLAVLHQRRTSRLNTHPFHWAAFVAAGDWR